MNFKHFISLATTMAVSLTMGHATECQDKKFIETTQLTAATGEVITMQRYNCTNVGTGDAIARREPPYNKRTTLDLNAKRSAAQCTQSNCLCGIACPFTSCRAANIKASDCSTLGNGLLNMNSPATFFIPPGQGAAFFVETCEASVNNPLTASTMEYCFSDLGANTLTLVNDCGSQEAICTGTFAGIDWFIGLISLKD